MGRFYRIHVYDAGNAQRLTILRNATRIRFTREIGGIGEIRFDIPRDDDQLPELSAGRFVRAFDTRTETDALAGIVTGAVDIGIEARFTRIWAYEALLRLAFCRMPPETRLRGSLADNLSRIIRQGDARRITAESTSATGSLGDEVLSFDGGGSGNQLGAFTNTESVNLSPASDPSDDGGAVVLTQSGGVYASSGTYVTPFIDFGSAPTAFDRLRYVADTSVGTVAYRIASFENLTDARTFTGSPVQGSQPRGVGIDISGLTPRRYVAVEFTLTTPDTSQTPSLKAVEVIARRSVPGIAAPSGVPDVELGLMRVGGSSHLSVLDRLCGLFGLEYRLTPSGTFEMQSVPSAGSVGSDWGTDRRDACTFAEGVHGNLLRCERDDSELANFVVAVGNGEGSERLLCVVQDAASQATYGVRQAVPLYPDMTLADLKADADAYLARHKEPRVALTFELLAGDAPFAPGDLVRIVSRHRRNHEGGDLDVSARVLRETREETDAGERILLHCADKPRSLTSELARWLGDERWGG